MGFLYFLRFGDNGQDNSDRDERIWFSVYGSNSNRTNVENFKNPC